MMKKNLVCGLIVTLIFSVFISFSFSQDVASKQEIKSRIENYSGWLALKAFANRDTALCDSARGSSGANDCFQAVSSYTFIRALAKGSCDSISGSYKDYIDVCQGVSKNNCSTCSGYKKDMCEALATKNADKLEKVFSDPDFPDYIRNRKERANLIVKLYSSFKTSSEATCNSGMSTDNLLTQASCNMLFGNKSFESKIDSITENISIALKAKSQRNKQLCGPINISAVKKACNDDSVKDMNDIFNIIWH